MIRAHFSGRTARNFFGKCVGLGDSFNAQIAAAPYYRDGLIGLREVRVDSIDRDGVYIRLVRSALAYSLEHDFAYRIFDDAKRDFGGPAGGLCC